jgi:hypothetical protein
MALSNAEKQKRWREKRNALAREALKHRQAGERWPPDTPKPTAVTMTHKEDGGEGRRPSGGLVSFLEESIRGLKQQLANERKLRKAAEAKLAAPASSPLTDDEKKQIKEMKAKLRYMDKEYNNALKRERDKHHAIIKKIDMKRATFNKVVRCLHPESRSHVTKSDLDEACGLFTQWKKDRDKA